MSFRVEEQTVVRRPSIRENTFRRALLAGIIHEVGPEPVQVSSNFVVDDNRNSPARGI